jgi:uncharacterized protein YbjT (DUF2867 family)
MLLIAGSNGHVGSWIMRKAAARGLKARCFDLRPPAVTCEGQAPEVITGDITDPAAVRRAMEGVEAVMYVVGLKRQSRQITHDMVEYGGMLNVISAARDAGVKHILYISALGVGTGIPATSLEAKGKTEQALQASGITHTIFRPSGYFTDFAEHFAPKIRDTGSFTLIGPGTIRLQPLAPEDLAEAFLQAINNDAARNRIFKISGTEIFTIIEIVHLVARVVGQDVRIRHMPLGLMKGIFSLMALVTGNRGGKDFLYRMSRDSVCAPQEQEEIRSVFSIDFQRLEPWLQAQLSPDRQV